MIMVNVTVPITIGRGQPWISVPKWDKLPEAKNRAAVKVEDRAAPRSSLPAEGIKVGRIVRRWGSASGVR